MNIGNQLKEVRIKQDLSLEHAATVLKLSPKLLTALENENTNIFFSSTYFLGHLKQYSNFLGINYNQNYFFISPKTELKSFQVDLNANTNPGGWMILLCLFLAILLTLLSNYFIDNLSSQKNWLLPDKKYAILD